MRSRLTIAFVLALALGALATPALAGGWAVTTFDDLPPDFHAGQKYILGYTIRQHGATPVNVDRTEIVAWDQSGASLTFAGTREGPTGHYIATVLFPADGTYRWQVTQYPFGPQELGSLTVLPAASAGTSKDKADATAKDAAAKAAADKDALAAAAAEKDAMAKAVAEKDALAKASAEKDALAKAAAEKDAKQDAAVAAQQLPVPAAPAGQAPASDPVRTALPFAAAVAAVLFAWRLLTVVRGLRTTRAAA